MICRPAQEDEDGEVWRIDSPSEAAATRKALALVSLVFSVLALVSGYLIPLDEYSWMDGTEGISVVDPDSLLVATCLSLAAVMLAAAAAIMTSSFRRLGLLVLALSLLLSCRFAYIYVFQPETIWHQ
jgi:hypothetical protein